MLTANDNMREGRNNGSNPPTKCKPLFADVFCPPAQTYHIGMGVQLAVTHSVLSHAPITITPVS